MTFLEQNQFYSLGIAETLKLLQSSSEGLSVDEVERRKRLFGLNRIEEKPTSKFLLFLKQFHSIVVYVLLVASFISITLGKWHDFLIILFVIFINSWIAFWQELKSITSIASLQKLIQSRVVVKRDGTTVHIVSEDLVPGDYVLFSEGTYISADIRLCNHSGLLMDESILTGESFPVEKDPLAVLSSSALPYELKNMVFSGTTVARGSGSGVVVNTGKRTYFASILEKAKERSPDSPFTKAIRFFLQRYSLFLILFFSFIGFYGYLQHRSWTEVGYILVAELVSCIPEGLPIVVTLVLVVGAIALSKKKTYVRYLPSVETLGSTTIIASDKTGTITEGKLVVKDVYAKNEETLRLCAAFSSALQEGKGDSIDLALFEWAKQDFSLFPSYSLLKSYPFDSEKKMTATLYHTAEGEKLFVKGAYETLASLSSNTDQLPLFQEAMERFSSEGQRVIALGIGEGSGRDPFQEKIQLIGIVGFRDPPKKEIPKAILHAKNAGIRVLMITGDHPSTAQAIAVEIGLEMKGGSFVLTGKEIDSMDDLVLFQNIKNHSVIARALPEHKYRIVKVLQKFGEIVAVSGDGVNDVPALKAADLGIAMGDGTESAQKAAKMVIGDNNLNIIVEAIRYGRIITDNIRKVIYFLLSSGLEELCLISLAIFSGYPLPLSAVQILWINLVSSGTLDKTFPFIKEEGDVMARGVMSPLKQFFNKSQVARISFFGITMGIIGFFLFAHLIDNFSYEEAISITFTSIVLSQWLNGLQAQKERDPFFKNFFANFSLNPWVYLSLSLGVALQLMAIYGFPAWFHVVPLTLSQWTYPILFSLIGFFLVEARKWIEWFFMRKI